MGKTFDSLKSSMQVTGKDLKSDIDELTTEQADIVGYSISRNFVMPQFKMKHFIGQAGITPYGAMKQYLMEIQGREHSITSQEYELAKIELTIDEWKHDIEKTDDEFVKRRAQIEINYAEAKRDGFVRLLRGHREERLMYLNLIQELSESEYGTLEDGSKLIDIFDHPEKTEAAERDYWIKRLGKQSAMDMIAYGKVGVGNMDSLTMLTYEDQTKAIELASDVFVHNERRTAQIVHNSNEQAQLGNSSELTEQLKISIQKGNNS
jgi:hypothetical protein